MKKLLSFMLSFCMIIGILSGCSSDNATSNEASSEPSEEVQTSLIKSDEILASSQSNVLSLLEEADENYSVATGKSHVSTSDSKKKNQSEDAITINNVDYVMIYNPYVYEEAVASPSMTNLYTGDFSDQIAINSNRADLFELDIQALTMPTSNSVDFEFQHGGRAPGLVEKFKVGEKSDFFYFTDMRTNERESAKFTCQYAGEHCYVWSLKDAISKKDAEKYGKEFDETIYNQDVESFGEPRYADEGGKINLLFYPIEEEGLCGLFSPLDIFSTGEVTTFDIKMYKLNVDRAIINVNSNIVGRLSDTQVCSTMAHELQHLICFTDTIENGYIPALDTWLNESMSAFAEEYIYPGVKEDGLYNIAFYPSENFKKGQSLYNFDTQNDVAIGAYGAVYLFEEYLRSNVGDDVFQKIHSYWRNDAPSDATDADAIYNSLPEEFIEKINDSLTYSEEISSNFNSESEEFVSKLAFNFYIETLSENLGKLDDFKKEYNGIDVRDYMIYDEVAPVDIEGGGRIVVATLDGSYVVPEDAAPELLYVGLDANFNVVTDVIFRGSAASGNKPTSTATDSNTDNAKNSTDKTGNNNTNDVSFNFKWKGTGNTNIYSTNDISSSLSKSVEKMLKECGARYINKISNDSLTKLLEDRSLEPSNQKNVGIAVFILPEKLTQSDIDNFNKITEKLISQGTLVAYVTADAIDPYKHGNVGLYYIGAKGKYNSTLASHSDDVALTIAASFADITNGLAKSPTLFKFSDK